jgi:hypothetical protein
MIAYTSLLARRGHIAKRLHIKVSGQSVGPQCYWAVFMYMSRTLFGNSLFAWVAGPPGLGRLFTALRTFLRRLSGHHFLL